ncbi:MAG: hypothetical protein AMJ46_06765 [Latescibacteria bacterium DG_63]|nr:MAG: hypothetical protein AMJ46_06765 [Latescibacteria bacterium DG_63]
MKNSFFLLLGVLSVSGAAHAEVEQDTVPPQPKYTLEEVLVTASRISESPLKLPAQVSIIDGKDLRLHGTSELADLTYLVPTSNLSSFGYLGALSTLSIRNAKSEQVLFLLDGRPLNDPQNGVFNVSTVPLCLLHRIELIRGGASSLWGANAVGGVVNLVTNRFGQGLPYTRISLKSGSQNTSITEVQFGRQIGNRTSFFLCAELKKSDGFRTNSDFLGKTVGGNFRHSIAPLWEVGIGVRRYEGELGVPGDTIYLETLNAREEDYRLDADITLRGKTADHETEVQVFGSDIWNTYTNPDFDYGETNRTKLVGMQLEQNYILLAHHKATYGLYGETIFGEIKDEEHRPHLLSQFLHIEWKLREWFNLFTGARVDCHSAYDRQVSPSIGVTLSLEDRYAVYLTMNRSFRAPTLNEMYYPGFGNPDLLPEKSREIESGLKLESSRLNGHIAYFHRWAQDMIEYGAENGIWAPYNIGEANIEGIECGLHADWHDFLNAGLNFSLSKARDGADNPLIYQPEKRMGGFVSLRRAFKDDKIEGTLLLSGEYTDRRVSEAGDELPAYFLSNAKLSCRVLALTFFFRVQNLSDSEYELRRGYPMPGRNHIFGLEWELWD